MAEALFTGVWVTPNTYTIAKSYPIKDSPSWKLYHKSLLVNSLLYTPASPEITCSRGKVRGRLGRRD